MRSSRINHRMLTNASWTNCWPRHATASTWRGLDVGLPDISGFELCKALRRFSDAPVLFLTARNTEVDRIVGLEIGGDDYVSKPFSPREVAARVKVILKRLRPRQADPAENGEFQHEPAARRIRYRGAPLELTVSEYRLLACLLEHPGRIYTRAELLDRLELPAEIYDRSIDGHIKTLRAKLKQVDRDAEPVQTHRGLGYSLKAGSR